MESGFLFSEVSSFFYTAGQIEQLGKYTIGIAGAGGIGSNCMISLVRSGISRFILADFDRVTASNLNRQAYSFRHIGRVKVDCLVELCRDINPGVVIETHALRVDHTNAHELFDTCDIIIEAFDDPAAKSMLFTEYLSSEKTLIGVSGIAGIGRTGDIAIREVRPNCFIVGDSVSAVSDNAKPYAPRVMVAAAKMADIALESALRPGNSRVNATE